MGFFGKKPFREPVPGSVPAFGRVLSGLAKGGVPPAVPQNVSWNRSIAHNGWGGLGNSPDQLVVKPVGDCTVAAACHMMMCWSDNAQPAPWTFLTPDALKDFKDYKTSPDGATLFNILNDWQAYGIHRRSGASLVAVVIEDFALLDLNHPAQLKLQVQQSIQLLGGCYIGIELPKYAVKTVDGKQPPLDWNKTAADLDAMGKDADKAPNAGHCVPAIGYDASGLEVITWGNWTRMSWDFFSRYRDEAWAVLCKAAWMKGDGTTPSGLTANQLDQDFNTIANRK
jgi:hypothetical protein